MVIVYPTLWEGQTVGEGRNKEAKQAGVSEGAGPGGLQKE